MSLKLMNAFVRAAIIVFLSGVCKLKIFSSTENSSAFPIFFDGDDEIFDF